MRNVGNIISRRLSNVPGGAPFRVMRRIDLLHHSDVYFCDEISHG